MDPDWFKSSLVLSVWALDVRPVSVRWTHRLTGDSKLTVCVFVCLCVVALSQSERPSKAVPPLLTPLCSFCVKSFPFTLDGSQVTRWIRLAKNQRIPELMTKVLVRVLKRKIV